MDRSKQPEIKSIEQLNICQPVSTTLTNGIEMKCLKINHTEIVRVDFMFKGGQWAQEVPLQTHYAFRQLKEGTQSISGEKIAEKLDYYGATLETSSNVSYSIVTLFCLKKYLVHIIHILQSIFSEPSYDKDKLHIALSQGKAAYAASLLSVGTQCKQVFYKNLYGEKHPMSQYPLLKDYETLTPDMLQHFRNKNINSDNCKIFVTGGYDDHTIKRLADAFGHSHWGGEGMFDGYTSFTPTKSEGKRFYAEMDNFTVQSAIKVGCLFPERRHKDFAVINITTTILGGYFGSRLMSNIRETKGYTYDINSAIYQSPGNTTFAISTETPHQYTELVIEEIYKEMDRLCKEPVSDDELTNVKNYLSGHLCRNYETGFNMSQMFMRLDITQRTINDVVKEFEDMKRITQEDVMQCASSYFNHSSMIECVARHTEE